MVETIEGAGIVKVAVSVLTNPLVMMRLLDNAAPS
jgi:hypothetical protein